MLEVIAEIMGKKSLPFLDRVAAVFNLLMIAVSKKKRKACNYLPNNTELMGIMFWTNTSQGHNYWDKINDAN